MFGNTFDNVVYIYPPIVLTFSNFPMTAQLCFLLNKTHREIYAASIGFLNYKQSELELCPCAT